MDQLVVGFDLDMTLIDTKPGFAATLAVLGDELGVAFPAEEMTARLGPPLEDLLRDHLAEDAVAPAGDRFRALYPDHAVHSVPAFAGAHEALAAVRRHEGRILLVTGKYAPNAQLHVEHLGLDVDHVEGWVWGAGKAEVLRAEAAQRLRRRPRPRRRGSPRRGGDQRVRADRRLHPRGARGGRHRTWCSTT